jgi:hypothetical protein
MHVPAGLSNSDVGPQGQRFLIVSSSVINPRL